MQNTCDKFGFVLRTVIVDCVEQSLGKFDYLQFLVACVREPTAVIDPENSRKDDDAKL